MISHRGYRRSSQKANHIGTSTVTTSPAERKYLSRHVVVPITFAMFAIGIWSSALGPLVPQISRDFGVPVALVGQVATVSMLTLAFSSLVTGPLADRYGHRKSVLAGMAISALMALVYAGAPLFVIILIAAAFAGIAIAMTHGVSFGIVITNYLDEELRRRELGFCQAGMTFSGVVGVPIVTIVATYLEWRWTFGAIAILLLIALLFTAWLIPNDPPDQRVRLSPRVIYHIEEPLLAHWPTNYLYLAAALRIIGFSAPTVYLTAFFIDTYGFRLVQVGLILSISSIGIFVGNLFGASSRLEKFSLRYVFATVTSLFGIGWFIVLTIQPPSYIAIIILTVVYFLAGISLISYMSLLSDITPSSPATTMTLNTAVLALGSGAGSAIGGALLHLGGYTAIGLAIPVFTTTAAVLMWQPRLVRQLLPETDSPRN